MDKDWRKKLAVLWLAQFVGMSAITGLISFLPLYVSHLGITDTAEAAMWAGVLIGAASHFREALYKIGMRRYLYWL